MPPFDPKLSGDIAAPLLSLTGLSKYIGGSDGRALVVGFYAPWCPHCHKMYESGFVDAARKSPVSFAIVNADKHGLKFREGFGKGLVTLTDAENKPLHSFSDAVKSYPTIILFNGKGRGQVYDGGRTESELLRAAETLRSQGLPPMSA